jgi:hypothetical protein
MRILALAVAAAILVAPEVAFAQGPDETVTVACNDEDFLYAAVEAGGGLERAVEEFNEHNPQGETCVVSGD